MMATATLGAETCAARGQEWSARRRYWVLPELQGRFIAWLVAASAVVATTVSWTVLLLVWGPISRQFVYAGGPITYERFFADVMLRVASTTGLLILGFGLISFAVGLMISHRIAGPLHRIQSVAANVARGKHGERVVLRQKDYIHDFADHFNRMLDHFDARESSLRRALAEVRDDFERLDEILRAAESVPDGASAELRERARAIREKLTG